MNTIMSLNKFFKKWLGMVIFAVIVDADCCSNYDYTLNAAVGNKISENQTKSDFRMLLF